MAVVVAVGVLIGGTAQAKQKDLRLPSQASRTVMNHIHAEGKP
jgi:hypothetical protein